MAPRNNPFHPRLEGSPLALTFDGRSLPELRGPERREAEFLLRLAQLPVVDALVLDAPNGYADQLPRARLDDPDYETDQRLVRPLDFPKGFLGGVHPWSSSEREAEELALAGPEREHFLYYEAVTWWHRNSERHYYVTADERLLQELRDPASPRNLQSRRIVSVRGALGLAGWMMRSREQIFIEASPGYTQETSNYDYFMRVAHALAPNRLRLHGRLEAQPPNLDRDELDALGQSLHLRACDLLRARDGVALQTMREQNNATRDAIIYHVHAAIPGAAALCDTVAIFAARALGIATEAEGGPSGLSLRRRPFRKTLRERGAKQLSARAGGLSAYWAVLSALRDPIVHRAGISGIGYVALPGPQESRLTLSAAQGEAIAALATEWKEDVAAWGLDVGGGWGPTLDPFPFTDHFVRAALRIADQLAAALANDLGASSSLATEWDDWDERAWRLALLGGLADEPVLRRDTPESLSPLGRDPAPRATTSFRDTARPRTHRLGGHAA